MLIITYIMAHTLTIVDDTLDAVLDEVRWTPPPPGHREPFTSPRLANRQLKFYFAVLRSNIYGKILKWQQQVLHTSGKKEESWLTSFCAMLGFAMVLEELQRTIMIQADAKIIKEEMPEMEALFEAENACARIDKQYRLLVGLFQHKYRARKWGENGSFGPCTPQFSDAATNDFLVEVRGLVERGRKFSHNACAHGGLLTTSR
jgi:hypothetical protein